MNLQTLKAVMLENQREVERQTIIPRHFNLEDFGNYIIVGIRRAGKSFLMYQRMQQLLSQGIGWNRMLYINFEDERLQEFTTQDFNSILECHMEMYDGERPMLFLDEIQIVEGWEKFARRLADQKYRVYISGSNAKMLSSEFMTTLGGRYIPIYVYPYSFVEYLEATETPHDETDRLTTAGRAAIKSRFADYLSHGGFPEGINLGTNRDYLTSVYQKIYLNDIASRNNISNTASLNVMFKKLAESVMQPISFLRLASVITATGRSVSANSVAKYIDAAVDAWLITPVSNIAAPLSQRESSRKYYFTDNGLLNLFLINQKSSLLENLVATTLLRRFGREQSVYFNSRPTGEVDFYIPENETAYQVTYSVTDLSARSREITAFRTLSASLPCARRVILTYDDHTTISTTTGSIEVLPLWLWLLTE